MRWGTCAAMKSQGPYWDRGWRNILVVVAAGLSLAACQHRNPYEPPQEALTGLSPQKQWCLRALYLMSNHRVADEGRMAIYEMAKNKGCFK